MSDVGDGVHGVLHGVVIAALELADGDDHIEFFCAETGESSSFLTKGRDEGAPKGNPMTTPTGMPVPERISTAVGTHMGLTMAQAKR